MARSLWIDLGLFVMATGLILVVGPRLSRSAEQLAGVTGTTQTLAGALFLGASTSLPGMIVSLQTAVNGRATIPLANSLGGSPPRPCSSRSPTLHSDETRSRTKIG